MGQINIDELKGKMDSFDAGDIGTQASSMFGDALITSLQGGGGGLMELIGGIADGLVTTDDVSLALGLLAKYSVEAYWPGIPIIGDLAKTLVGEPLGTELGPLLPTDIELFPSSLSTAPPQPKNNLDAGFGAAKGAMSAQMAGLADEIKLDNIQQSSYDDIDGMIPSDEQFDEAMVLVEKFIDDPGKVFNEVLGEVGGQFDTTLQNVSKSAEAVKGAVEEQISKMREKHNSTVQKNETLAKQNDFLTSSYQSSFGAVLSNTKIAGVNSMNEKLDTPGISASEITRITSAKDKLANLDVGTASTAVFKDMAKGEMKGLNDSINNVKKMDIEMQDVMVEYGKMGTIDLQTIGQSAKGDKIKELTGLAKSVIKVIKIVKTMKSTLNPMLNQMQGSTESMFAGAIPELQMDELKQLSASVTKQLPNDSQILQENGMENVQSVSDDIMLQLNVIKDRQSVVV